MKRLTHIEQQRSRIIESEQLAKALCGYTDQEFADLQFESAYQYLDQVLGTDAWGMHEYPKHRAFWSWWRIQWHHIDLAIFGCPHKGIVGRLQYDLKLQAWYCSKPDSPEREYLINNARMMRRLYEIYHKVGVENRYINSAATEAAFHSMQKTLIKQ